MLTETSTPSHPCANRASGRAAIAALLVMLLGAACDTNEQPGQPPAPLGEITALERLADGYQAVTDTLAANPVMITPPP
ncbi:MAG: hypothetical protein FD130_1238 [Halothiobacillaceae bacterium]|nr:MAG: hypothetical protein FD130_1238 [Halothiobacillaceae bacterium]